MIFKNAIFFQLARLNEQKSGQILVLEKKNYSFSTRQVYYNGKQYLTIMELEEAINWILENLEKNIWAIGSMDEINTHWNNRKERTH